MEKLLQKTAFPLLLFLVLIISGPVSASTTYKQTVATNAKKLVMAKGEKTQITIKGNAQTLKRTITIKNPKIVKKSGQNLIALKTGTTTVTIKQGKLKVKLKVKVKNPIVVLSGKTTFKLSVDGLKPTWSSTSPGIVSIEPKTGIATPKIMGRTQIKASAHGMEFCATVDVTENKSFRIVAQTSPIAITVPSPTPTNVPTPTPTFPPMPTFAPTPTPTFPPTPTPTPVPLATPTPEPILTPTITPAPTDTPEEPIGVTYILNRKTRKFHLPTCSAVKKILPENLGKFIGDRETLLEDGYSPCGICKP